MALSVRRERRKSHITWRLHEPKWEDPYPWIPGTTPEKMLFAALVQRRVYFVFQGSLPKLPGVHAYKFFQDLGFKPDIVLPEYGVILDPFGEFHHTQPESVKRDWWKAAYYDGQGYSFYHPWASEITEKGADEYLMRWVKELQHPPKYRLSDPRDIQAKATTGYRLGEFLGAGASSVGAANRKRAKPRSPMLKARRRHRS